MTIIANNKYAGGRHIYDYQLVRLSEGQVAAERRAMEKADQIYKTHAELSTKESEMEKKFESTRAQLEQYKDKFMKTKK